MKRLMIVASLAVLGACSQAEEADPVAEVTETAAPEPVQAMAADGQPAPGFYTVTTSEGEVFNEEVKADGTYVQKDATGKVVETGRWEQKSPEQYCYTVDEAYREEGDTGEQKCNTEGIREDGVWFSTSPDGKTATVERASG